MKNIYYYEDFDSDVVTSKNQDFKLKKNYKWVHHNIFYKISSYLLYYIFLFISFIYVKLILHVKFVNKKVLSGKKNLSKGIKVDVGEKETKIDVNIIVDYGVRIPDIAFDIQNRVKSAVEGMTGLKVTAVNVHVQGVNTEANTEADDTDSEN